MKNTDKDFIGKSYFSNNNRHLSNSSTTENVYFDKPNDNSITVNDSKKTTSKQMKFWLFLIGFIMILITSYAFYDFYKKNYKDVPVTFKEFSKNFKEYLKNKANKDCKLTSPLLLFKDKGKEANDNILKKFENLYSTKIKEEEIQRIFPIESEFFEVFSIKNLFIENFLKEKKYKIKFIDDNFIFFIGEVLIDGSGKYLEDPKLRVYIPEIKEIIECLREAFNDELEQ
ncbi:hypothetical protein A0H76_1688 [Hepatospora eriocheir]|uniref:Uncharacterized protein n=1 Tax=Hepatospora eriocheir TaxID=1081669 RepID=A0A1X0QKK4_9MICR|nr:hypothetical protein A0H76_1688 [Hepatospora eriocheir]